jgi:hypothetical protein
MRKFKKIKKLKKRKINSNKIYLVDWEKTKPYKGNKKYSEFYTSLSNDILEVIQSNKDLFKTQELGIVANKKLAIILTSYFEDYINEIGIWDYFVQKNQELYGWSVPFFLTDIEREEDEIYVADIAFLIWFFISQTNDTFLNPEFPAFITIAQEVFEILEEKMDVAPTTDYYDQFFDIPDDIHFFELKKRLNWFALGSYLLGFEFGIDLADSIEELQESNPKFFESGVQGEVIYAMQDDYNYKRRSSLSAISNLEWFSAIAKCSLDTKTNILQLHKRIMGNFIYEGKKEGYYQFRNVHTDLLFDVHQDSIDLDAKKIKKGEMAAFTIMKWQGDWWLSGMFMGMGKLNDAQLMEMRKEISSIPFYAYSEADQAATWEVVNEGHEYFIEFFGNPIKIFKDKSEMQHAMSNFYVFQRKKAMAKKGKELSEADIQETKSSTASMLSSIDRGIGKPLAVVSVDKVGISFTENIPVIINQLESDDLPEAENDLFYDLFIDDMHPTTARDILAAYPTKHLKMPFAYSTIDVLAHAEFFLRYYSPNEFGEQVPNMRVVPEGMDVEMFKKRLEGE